MRWYKERRVFSNAQRTRRFANRLLKRVILHRSNIKTCKDHFASAKKFLTMTDLLMWPLWTDPRRPDDPAGHDCHISARSPWLIPLAAFPVLFRTLRCIRTISVAEVDLSMAAYCWGSEAERSGIPALWRFVILWLPPVSMAAGSGMSHKTCQKQLVLLPLTEQ